MVVDLGSYLTGLVGRPWERHGLHCWALVERVERELFAREVPIGPAAVPARPKRCELLAVEAEAVGWTEVDRPQDGAVVRMYRAGGNPADLEHAGVYLAIDGGRILHTNAPHGVVLDSLVELNVRGWVPRFFVPQTERSPHG